MSRTNYLLWLYIQEMARSEVVFRTLFPDVFHFKTQFHQHKIKNGVSFRNTVVMSVTKRKCVKAESWSSLKSMILVQITI